MRKLVLFLAACSNAATPAGTDAPHGQSDAPTQSDGSMIDGTVDVGSPLSYTGGTYTNHFDGLPTAASSASAPSQTLTGVGPFAFSALTGMTAATGMDGWQLANPTGTSMNTEFRAQDGSQSGSSGRGVISYGADGSSQRALGSLASGADVPVFGLVLKNDTSGTLTQATIGFTGEQWRRGTVTKADSLTFEIGLGSDIAATGLTEDKDLDFASPNTQAMPTDVAIDGTAAANKAIVSKTVTGLTWAAGTTLVLRWTADNGSGHDDGLAIDDFTFSAAP